MSLAQHFLRQLQALLDSKQEGYKSINIQAEAAGDLRLWHKLLGAANKGLSLNCLVVA
jgi:hypothetical protein